MSTFRNDASRAPRTDAIDAPALPPKGSSSPLAFPSSSASSARGPAAGGGQRLFASGGPSSDARSGPGSAANAPRYRGDSPLFFPGSALSRAWDPQLGFVPLTSPFGGFSLSGLTLVRRLRGGTIEETFTRRRLRLPRPVLPSRGRPRACAAMERTVPDCRRASSATLRLRPLT